MTTDDQPERRVDVSPLLPPDPAKVGDFWLDARISARPAGTAYAAHDDRARSVLLIMLNEGAASDPAAADRLAGLVNQLHIDTVVARGGKGQDGGRLAARFRPPHDGPAESGAPSQAPWVALAYDGSPAAVAEAERILAGVELADRPALGQPSGPDYRLPWIDRQAPGPTRIWPLPWPGRRDRSGWGSILASWLLMILIAALAILIAILLFQGTPPESPPPPVPTTGPASSSSSSPSPQSGSPSPQSGSPSPESASPSPDSASPSPSSASPSPDTASPSASASPSPDTATPTASASPSPDSASPTPTSASPSPATASPETPTASGGPTPSGIGSPTPNSRL
ncbi:MAG: hypothetical protein LBR32_08765 [Propionibacteriaceae bacterium]|nr:hypothetical protein [Propionibacteriaceae bacterium]